jgi:peptidoglycan/xylan/chitin deacetylase (PgdA/CDA1 family)
MRLIILLFLGLFSAAGVTAAVGEKGLSTEQVDCPILIFHSVRPYSPKDTKGERRFIATPDTLESELAYLRSKGYEPVTFYNLANHLLIGAPLPPKPVIISFDDGWESQYVYALPLLKKYSFTATFFIYSNAPGVKNYMSWDQIKALSAAGMEIGCHSKSHPYLKRIKKKAALRKEIFLPKRILEAHLGKAVTVYAYPFGLYDDRAIAMVKEAGFLCARRTFPGISHSADQLFTLTGLIRTATPKTLIEILEEHGRK